MTDREFKRLCHNVGCNQIGTRGEEVSPGYKPDLSIRNPSGDLKHIVEHENKTDRKSFLGDVVKAEKYAGEQSAADPTLIIVMKQHDQQTTVSQIVGHLSPYASWLAGLKGGRLDLSAIRIIEEKDYLKSLDAKEILGSHEFNKRATSVPVEVQEE